MQVPGNISARRPRHGSGGESSANPEFNFLGHIPRAGQLAVSRLYAANEMRQATITPHGVRVHTVVEYRPVPVQPGATPPLLVTGMGEVSIRGMARPCYPHGLLAGGRLILSTERLKCFRSQSSNLPADSPMPLRDVPAPPGFQAPVNENSMAPLAGDEHVGSWTQLRGKSNPNTHYDNRLHKSPVDSEPIEAEPLQVYVPAVVPNRNALHANINSNRHAAGVATRGRRYGSRRTRSVTHKKYGPYTCSRCMDVFATSQSFAAHAGAHYRKDGRASNGEPIVSIQNAGKRRGRNNRRPSQRIPYFEPGMYSCPKCDAKIETLSMFTAHVTSHFGEDVVRRLSRETYALPLNPQIGGYGTVDWLASIHWKAPIQHGKSADKDVPSTPPPGPSSSSSSSSSVPPKAEAAIKMEPNPEDDDEVVEVDIYGDKIKAEPW